MLEGKGLTLGDLMGACLDANRGPLRYQRSKQGWTWTDWRPTEDGSPPLTFKAGPARFNFRFAAFSEVPALRARPD
jgi:hypothetical protein